MTNTRVKVADTFQTIEHSPRYKIGDIVFVQKENKTYVNTVLGWQEVELEQTLNAGNLYDLNKDAIQQLSDLSPNEQRKLVYEINHFVNKTANNYYMLLSNELKYYTLLVHEPTDKRADFWYCGKGVNDLLLEINKAIITYDIYDDRVEIWVRDNNNEAQLYIFFPYDGGVVTYQYV